MGFFKWLKEQWDEAGRFIEEELGEGGGGAPPVHDPRPLEERIADAGDYLWTKEELNAWLDTLPEQLRTSLLQSCKRIARGGQDWMMFLCKMRIDLDKKQREREAAEAAQASSGRSTIGSLLWAYDEARLMSDQRAVFGELRKRMK